jgi:hypothetical protein
VSKGNEPEYQLKSITRVTRHKAKIWSNLPACVDAQAGRLLDVVFSERDWSGMPGGRLMC